MKLLGVPLPTLLAESVKFGEKGAGGRKHWRGPVPKKRKEKR